MPEFSVTILGSNSATPAHNRYPSAQVVNHDHRLFLVDAGEGAQVQFLKFRQKFNRLDAIYISHLHGDHIMGLPGLISTLNMNERSEPLRIYAPAGIQEILEVILRHSDTRLRYPVEFLALEDVQPGGVISENREMVVRSLPLEHRVFTRGFLFQEKPRKRRLDYEKAQTLGVPVEYFRQVKQGLDITLDNGQLILADDLLSDPVQPRSYAYCSDTQYTEALIPHLSDIDLLYHEATFTEEKMARAMETMHSTARQAGMIARAAKVKRLIIGHFSSRYKDLTPLLDEAREIFPDTDLALEGSVHHV